MSKKMFSVLLAAALFCAGVACGWLLRGDDKGTGVSPVQSGKSVDSQVAPNGESVAEQPQFTEAISNDEFRRQQGPAGETTVEEVKGEDGLTVEERVEKFKRERPDEFAALVEAAARSVGVEGAEDVKRFRETISAIFEATREPESGLRRR